MTSKESTIGDGCHPESREDRGATFVFVHLGPNPAPLTSSMADHAMACLPGSRAVLVTDRPTRWANFPGVILAYKRSGLEAWLEAVERRFPEKRLASGGYWIKTLERLFALDRVLSLGELGPIIHVESDVLSLIDQETLSLMQEAFARPAVPRLGEKFSCASTIFFPCRDSLGAALEDLRSLAGSQRSWFTDMELLSQATYSGFLEELPTAPHRGLLTRGTGDASGEEPRVIFDALALGQYLFGQDPFHTGGFRISGHRWPDFPEDLGTWKWSIEQAGAAAPRLMAQTPEARVRIASVHLHSKVDPGPLQMPAGPLWQLALDEANGVRVRTRHPVKSVHTAYTRAPALARLMAWRHDGLPRVRESLRYRMRFLDGDS